MELLSLCVMLLCTDRFGREYEFSYPTPLTEQHAQLIIEEKEEMYDILHDVDYTRYWVHEDRESFKFGQNKHDYMMCYTEKPPFLK